MAPAFFLFRGAGDKKRVTGVAPITLLVSGWADLNRRPLVPQTSTLNPCATARIGRYNSISCVAVSILRPATQRSGR